MPEFENNSSKLNQRFGTTQISSSSLPSFESLSPQVRDILNRAGYDAFQEVIQFQNLDSLRSIIDTLENSTSHLLESNKSLKEFQQLEPPNSTDYNEYTQYIQDNLNTIEANNFRVQMILSVIASRNLSPSDLNTFTSNSQNENNQTIAKNSVKFSGMNQHSIDTMSS